VLAAVVLVAVIGFGAYKLKPVLNDMRHPESRIEANATTSEPTPSVAPTTNTASAATPAAGETSAPQSDAANAATQNSPQPGAATPSQPAATAERSDSQPSSPQKAY